MGRNASWDCARPRLCDAESTTLRDHRDIAGLRGMTGGRDWHELSGQRPVTYQIDGEASRGPRSSIRDQLARRHPGNRKGRLDRDRLGPNSAQPVSFSTRDDQFVRVAWSIVRHLIHRVRR